MDSPYSHPIVLRAMLAATISLSACTSHPSVAIPPGQGAMLVTITETAHGPVHPLKDAVVTIVRSDGSRVLGDIRTDSSGTVLFNSLEPGRYRLRIRSIGFVAAQLEVIVLRGKLHTERIRLVDEIESRCPPAPKGGIAICM